MIRDAQNTFCKDLAVSAFDADAKYTNIIDGTAAGDAVDQMYLMIANTTALKDGTLTATLQTCALEDFSSDVVDLGAYAVAKTKGVRVRARVPIGCLQYLRVKFVATLDADKTSLGAGVVTAALVYDVEIS